MPQPLQPVIYEDAQGNRSLEVDRITSVGIKDIGFVERHEVNTRFGSRSHVVRFVNGGLLQYAYNAKSELIELTASNLTIHISRSGAVMLDVSDDWKQGVR